MRSGPAGVGLGAVGLDPGIADLEAGPAGLELGATSLELDAIGLEADAAGLEPDAAGLEPDATDPEPGVAGPEPEPADPGVIAAIEVARSRGAIRRSPRSHAAVSERRERSSARGVPWNTTSPPFSPGPGPRSMIRSAARMICGSCSTTSRVLPAARSLCSTETMRATSRACSPMLGSSSTNRVFTSEAPSAVVRLMRWTSPPDRVRDWRSRVR